MPAFVNLAQFLTPKRKALEYSLELLSLLFVVAVIAGFVDAISGGGGLIALPALMLAGIPPIQALATNKLQALFGKLSSVRYFLSQGLIDLSRFRSALILCFVCSAFGTLMIQALPATLLQQLLPWMIAAAAVYLMFAPGVGDVQRKAKLGFSWFAFAVLPIIAFYDGFFGPASGSFFLLAFMVLLGFSSTKAVAHSRLVLLVTNAGALVVYAWSGQVLWLLGLVMALGQWIGAYLGSKLVYLKGSKIVKPMLILVCLLMLVKLVVTG